MASILARLGNWFNRKPLPLELPYHVYTRQFDAAVKAEALDSVLSPLSEDYQLKHAMEWNECQASVAAWLARTNAATTETLSRIRDTVPDDERMNLAVSILIDHSGSMAQGQLIKAAAFVHLTDSVMVSLGRKVEILGFTTLSWEGGQSRQLWLRSGKPAYPGRLCDLLHIIYKDAHDDRSLVESGTLKPMLRPELLRENIDGEAIEWAASRLQARPEPRKILLVLSDGAPVDDSTLMANDPAFLVSVR